jgi:hypothetical protein
MGEGAGAGSPGFRHKSDSLINFVVVNMVKGLSGEGFPSPLWLLFYFFHVPYFVGLIVCVYIVQDRGGQV